MYICTYEGAYLSRREEEEVRAREGLQGDNLLREKG
jgi:hypothetical protein